MKPAFPASLRADLRFAPVLGLLAALCLSVPAGAQSSDQSAPKPTAAQLAAAKEVVLASGIARSFDIFVPQIESRLNQTLTTTRPEIADDLAIVLKQIEPEFQARQSQIIDLAAAAFAARMSEQELKDTAAFFNTPTGKKYVEVQPPVLDQIVNGIQDWTRKISEDMLTRVKAEMKKKGHDL